MSTSACKEHNLHFPFGTNYFYTSSHGFYHVWLLKQTTFCPSSVKHTIFKSKHKIIIFLYAETEDKAGGSHLSRCPATNNNFLVNLLRLTTEVTGIINHVNGDLIHLKYTYKSITTISFSTKNRRKWLFGYKIL